jgi:acetyltransferase-like isoleucine patch superfamily enzyme
MRWAWQIAGAVHWRLAYWSRRINAWNIRNRVSGGASLSCGPYAHVFNHGGFSNIELGQGVMLDGTLECYERGRLCIGDYTYIGRSRVFAACAVSIGTGVLVADHVVIMDSNLHAVSAQRRFEEAIAWRTERQFPDVYSGVDAKPVRIGDNAWIGANSVVLKGVTIGEAAIVGAGSVVTRDVPPYTIVAGNPARKIRELAPNER